MITHQLKTYDRQVFPLTTEDCLMIERAMRDGKAFIQLKESIIATKNISAISKIQQTAADVVDSSRRIGRGNVKFDPNGKGYKSFLAAKEKLIRKMSVRNEDKI